MSNTNQRRHADNGQALLGDKVMLAAIVVSAIAAVVIGFLYYEPTLGVIGALAFAGLGAAVFAVARGTMVSRLVLVFALVALVALHIQLARGEIEYHFGVFVTLALLLVYLDWRPIVLAAALLGAIGYGATFIGIVSMTLSLVGRRAPQNPGKAMARLTLSYGAAQMLAPVVAGAMAQATGTFKGALWLTAGVMLLGMALLATLPEEQAEA